MMDQDSNKKFEQELLREFYSHAPDFMTVILSLIPSSVGVPNTVYPQFREKCGETCHIEHSTADIMYRIEKVKEELKKINMEQLRSGDKDVMRASFNLIEEYRKLIADKKRTDYLHYDENGRKRVSPFLETSITCILMEQKEIPTYLINRFTASLIPYILPIIIGTLFNNLNQQQSTQSPLMGIISSILSPTATNNPSPSESNTSITTETPASQLPDAITNTLASIVNQNDAPKQ